MLIPLDETIRQHLLTKGQDRIQQMCSLRNKRIEQALAGQPVKGRVRYELMRLAMRLQSQSQHAARLIEVERSTSTTQR